MDQEKVNWHVQQARHYNLAVADPECADYDTLRARRKLATYHLDMADWYMAEPAQPGSTPELERHDNGEEHTNDEADSSTGSEAEEHQDEQPDRGGD